MGDQCRHHGHHLSVSPLGVSGWSVLCLAPHCLSLLRGCLPAPHHAVPCTTAFLPDNAPLLITLSWNARASPTADCPLSLVPQLLTHPGPQPSSSSRPPNGPPWCASPGTREIPGRGPHRKGLSMSVPTLPSLCIAPNDDSPLLLKLKMALVGEARWRAPQLCLSHPSCETGKAHVFRASVLFRAAHLALSTCRLTVLTVVVIIPPSSQGGP